MLCGHLLLAVVFAVTNCGSMMGEEPRKTFVLASDSSINPQSDILREAAVCQKWHVIRLSHGSVR
jgi:hypothetical protein